MNGESQVSVPQLIGLDERLEVREAAQVHALLASTLAAARGPLVVDLGKLRAVDTAGVQLLLAARREADRRGIHLRYRGEPAALIRALELLGLREAVLGKGP